MPAGRPGASTRSHALKEGAHGEPWVPPCSSSWLSGRAPPCGGGGRRFESSRRDFRRRASAGTHRSDTPASPGSTPGPSTCMPPWSNGHDAGLSIRKCGFDSRRRYWGGLRSLLGEPPGSPRPPPLVRFADKTLRAWPWGSGPPRRFREPEIAGSNPACQTCAVEELAVLASLMSSRPWVRIPPALLKDRPLTGGRGSDGTRAAQSVGPNVQLASTSLQGRPVRRWRRGHALAGAPMGNSWLRSHLTETSLPPVAGIRSRLPLSLFGGVAQLRRALACQARGRGFEPRRPRSMVAVV